MRICEAAAVALDILGKPSRVEEIFKIINEKKICEFYTENSMTTLINEMLKSCENVKVPKEYKQKLFSKVGPNMFSLLKLKEKAHLNIDNLSNENNDYIEKKTILKLDDKSKRYYLDGIPKISPTKTYVVTSDIELHKINMIIYKDDNRTILLDNDHRLTIMETYDFNQKRHKIGTNIANIKVFNFVDGSSWNFNTPFRKMSNTLVEMKGVIEKFNYNQCCHITFENEKDEYKVLFRNDNMGVIKNSKNELKTFNSNIRTKNNFIYINGIPKKIKTILTVPEMDCSIDDNKIETNNEEILKQNCNNVEKDVNHKQVFTIIKDLNTKVLVNKNNGLDSKLFNESINDNKELDKKCLVQELSRLKESSKEAVDGLGEFSPFKKYMHIEREAQKELEGLILNANQSNMAQLILVCGSVGDGKSHIISYFNNKYSNIMNKFTLHNDATESLEPNKTSMDTLNDVLDNFSDEKIEESNEKFILAVNLGTLNNFIDSKYGCRFSILKKYVQDKKILETSIENSKFDEASSFQFVNFSDYHVFTLKNGNVHSSYIKSLITKIIDTSELNIFYNSYKNNCSKCINCNGCPIKANYELLSNESVQESIVDLLVQCIIKSKVIISTRALINFMYELIIPRSYVDVNSPIFKNDIFKLNNLDYIKSLMPNIIFNHKELSFIFEALNSLDPLNVRNQKIDDFIIEFNNSTNILPYFKEHIDYPKGYIRKIDHIDFEETEDKKIRYELLKLFIRSYYVCGKANVFSLKDSVYNDYMECIYFWNRGDKAKLKTLYDNVKDGIIKWNGEAEKDQINIFMGKNQIKYKTSEELELKVDTSNLVQSEETDLEKLITTLNLKFKNNKLQKCYEIDVDFSLYQLLRQVIDGYRPNKKDKNHFIKFIEFINKLEETGSQNEKLLFTEKNRDINKEYKLEYDNEFEVYRFVEM